ncbi:hypothetical protein KI387_015530, partial [Taxus chinensis]
MPTLYLAFLLLLVWHRLNLPSDSDSKLEITSHREATSSLAAQSPPSSPPCFPASPSTEAPLSSLSHSAIDLDFAGEGSIPE